MIQRWYDDIYFIIIIIIAELLLLLMPYAADYFSFCRWYFRHAMMPPLHAPRATISSFFADATPAIAPPVFDYFRHTN